MKKLVKGLLFGVGITAAGLAVYSLWKGTEKSIVVWDSDMLPPTTPSKEYVEHRRQQIRDAAEARKAAQEETAPEESPDTVLVESNPSEQAAEQQKEP